MGRCPHSDAGRASPVGEAVRTRTHRPRQHPAADRLPQRTVGFSPARMMPAATSVSASNGMTISTLPSPSSVLNGRCTPGAGLYRGGAPSSGRRRHGHPVTGHQPHGRGGGLRLGGGLPPVATINPAGMAAVRRVQVSGKSPFVVGPRSDVPSDADAAASPVEDGGEGVDADARSGASGAVAVVGTARRIQALQGLDLDALGSEGADQAVAGDESCLAVGGAFAEPGGASPSRSDTTAGSGSRPSSAASAPAGGHATIRDPWRFRGHLPDGPLDPGPAQPGSGRGRNGTGPQSLTERLNAH